MKNVFQCETCEAIHDDLNEIRKCTNCDCEICRDCSTREGFCSTDCEEEYEMAKLIKLRLQKILSGEEKFDSIDDVYSYLMFEIEI